MTDGSDHRLDISTNSFSKFKIVMRNYDKHKIGNTLKLTLSIIDH